MSETRVAMSTSTNGKNCVTFSSDLHIVAGRAELVWTPKDEMTKTLRLYGAESWEHVFADSGSKPSPIHVEFADVRKENDVGEFAFVVMLGHDGVMRDQPARLTLNLTVAGVENLQPRVHSCFIG